MQEGREKRRRTRISADPLGDGPSPPTRSPASLCKELPWRAGCREHRCRGHRCRAQEEGLRGRRAPRDVPALVTVVRGGEEEIRRASSPRPLLRPVLWMRSRPLPEPKTTQPHREDSRKPQLRASLDVHAWGSVTKDQEFMCSRVARFRKWKKPRLLLQILSCDGWEE